MQAKKTVQAPREFFVLKSSFVLIMFPLLFVDAAFFWYTLRWVADLLTSFYFMETCEYLFY